MTGPHNFSNVREATVGETIYTLPLEIKWGGISESLERAVCVTLQKKKEKKASSQILVIHPSPALVTE